MEFIAFILSLFLLYIVAVSVIGAFIWLWRLGTPDKTQHEHEALSSNTEITQSAEAFFSQAHEFKSAHNQRRRIQLDREVRTTVPSLEKLSTIDYGRITFENIVLDAPSSNTPHTEIDQVILTPYGIFCIEYKAHTGIIFGSERQKTWTQCKYDGKYSRHNPLHQNYKHVKALENLLKGRLRAPIHSFVVYTNASKLNVDSKDVFLGIDDMEERIAQHTQRIYSLQEYERIATLLAVASTRSDDLMPVHIEEVQTYLASLSG